MSTSDGLTPFYVKNFMVKVETDLLDVERILMVTWKKCGFSYNLNSKRMKK